MTRHLLDLGHTRIGFIAGPKLLLDACERLEGYRDAFAEAGVAVHEDLIVPGDFNERSGREAMRALLARAPRPSAVFAANDESAIGAMQILKREGLRIPDDMALAGFDDIPLAQYVDPPLTTVHQPFYRLGEKAAEVLLATLAGRDAGGETSHVLRTRLVMRESCGHRRPSA
jgi:DNA-binding LacI/PurR family transcriptional regulator